MSSTCHILVVDSALNAKRKADHVKKNTHTYPKEGTHSLLIGTSTFIVRVLTIQEKKEKRKKERKNK